MFVSQVRDYLLGEKIGEGTFGKVRLAKHIPTNEIVAMKILDKQKYTISEKTKIRLMREMKILQQLNHPNLIQLYEIFENEQNWYLVMEYVDGGELFDFVVKRKRISESVSRNFFSQIVSGIAYCHSNDIVHRDLKLENLLLTSDFKIKIIDFGLSNFTKGNVLLNTFCGSASYAAPEVLQAKEYDGLKTDVWSLGVLLYVLLVGRFPYETTNIRALVAKKISKTINYPKFISESAKDLISKMLFIDPKLRYSINQVKKHEWFKQDIATKQLLDATSFYSGELINPLIVIKMTPLGSNYKDVLKDLQSKHFSQHMATYLIIRKQEKEGRFHEYQNMDNSNPITENTNTNTNQKDIKLKQMPEKEKIKNKNQEKNQYPLPKEKSFFLNYTKNFLQKQNERFS